jgi:hypothetical protein
MTRKYLEVKEFEGRRFYYLDVGSGYHGKANFRLWVNAGLVNFDEGGKPYIEFPISNARIVKTEKGNLVLRSYEGWYVFDVGIVCGYRGSSSFEILEGDDVELFEYVIYSSPVGSLGISHYGLVNAKSDKLKVKWNRTGRLYGEPAEGISVYYADGHSETLENIPDGIEALSELEGDAQ